MNSAIIAHIEQQFKQRIEAARQQGEKLKPGSAAYVKKQTEFFTGAMAALVAIAGQSLTDIEKIFDEAGGKSAFRSDKAQQTLNGKAMPPKWVFGIMRGDDILSDK